MDINFELYKTFYHVAKCGNITKAAQILNISQSAVSQSIKNLENMLSGTLFHRTKKGVLLTYEGKVLYDHIKKAYDIIIQGENRFLSAINLIEGELRVGASDTICKYFLMPHLTEFKKNYPDIKIHVTNKTSSECISMLKDGQVDLSVVTLPISDSGLSTIRCMAIHDIPVCGSKLHSKFHSKATLDIISKESICLLGMESNTRRYIEQYALSQNIKLSPEFELSSSSLLVDFAANNMGISFVIKEFCKDELSKGMIYEIPFSIPISPRSIGVVTLANVPQTSPTKKFIEQIT